MTVLRTTRWTMGVLAAFLIMGTTVAAEAATVSANKSIFSQGQWRGGITGGYVSTGGEDYLSLGLGVGYNVIDGLALGASYEVWLIGSPTVNKVSPWVGYTFHQMERIKPYVVGFWRQNWVSGYDSYQDVGARFGFYIPSGRNYMGLGVVYEYRLGDDGFVDQDRWYPEVRFAIGL